MPLRSYIPMIGPRIMATNDLTRRADLTRHGRGTGALRTQRPQYVDYLPPCNDACPAGENIQAWLALAQDGDYEAAWRELGEQGEQQKLTDEQILEQIEGVMAWSSSQSS